MDNHHPQFFDPIIEHYWRLPSITRLWFSLALLVTTLNTFDLFPEHQLVFNYHRLKQPYLELWRIVTSFTWAGPGTLADFSVLMLLYAMTVSVSSYEMNPHEAGHRSRRQNRNQTQSDCLFAFICCALLIVGSYLALNETGILDPLLQLFGLDASILEPLFTRNLLYSIITLDSFRNPDRDMNINFFPIQGRYVPLFHLGFAMLMDYRMNEIIHGILVAGVYLILITEDSPIAAILGRKRVIFKPHWIVTLVGEALEQDLDGESITLEQGANILHQAAAVNDLPVILARLRQLDSVPNDRIEAATAPFRQKDENDWQPLHEAARAGNVDVLKLLLEIDGSQRRATRLKVDINARTNGNRGCTALWLTEQNHGADSAASQILRNNGGISIGGVLADDSEQDEDLDDDSEEESIR